MKRIFFLLFLFLCFSSISFCDLHAQVLTEGEPSVLKEDKAPSNYVYDLKDLIRKSKENIRNVNDKIKEQAIQKRNQQREQKAREYYEQAQKLTEEGRLDEARAIFEKAIEITEHPEMKYYIKESEARRKHAEEALAHEETEQERRQAEEAKQTLDKVETAYQEAVSLYKQQHFKEAKEQFLLVQELSPDYKAVKSYLQIVDQDLMQSEQQAIKDQRKEIDRQDKEAEIARLREKELWRKEIDKKEKERELQLQKQAQDVYDEAIRLYQDRKYAAAKDKFQQVEWVIPDFKSTRSYLKRVENDLEKGKTTQNEERNKELEKQRWEETLSAKRAAEMREKEKLAQVREQAEFIFQAAVALFDKSQYSQAQEKFEEVENLYPNYRTTKDYLTRIATMTKTEAERKIWAEEMAKRKEEKENAQKKMNDADQLFTQALELYKMGRLIESKEKFIAVDQNVPDYKSCRIYLKKIDDDIAAMVMAKHKDSTLATQKQELDRLKEVRDKADYAYNEAIVAYDNKEYEKAKAGFQDVENIYPNYKKATYYLSRIDDDIKHQEEQSHRQKLEKDAESIYAQAIALYGSDQFEEAKKKFVDVAALVPDYKQTAFYLERIDDDIIRKKEKTLNEVQGRQAEVLYNQATSFYQSEEYEQAKEKFLELEAVFPSYKETPRYLTTIDQDIFQKKEKSEERVKAEQAEDIYKQALALYKVKDFESAKEKFIHITVIYPDYKDTSHYLDGIDGDIERKKKEAELHERVVEAEPIYAQAIDLYKSQEFSEAQKKFRQVQLIYPEYKDTTKYLARVEADKRLLEERIARDEKMHKAERIYAEALKLYNNRSFEEAKKKFFEVSGLDPNYKNVKNYVSRIDTDIHDEHMRQERLAQEEKALPIYAEAIDLYHNKKDFVMAKSMFIEVARILPDYKKTQSYLSRIDKDIRDQNAEYDRQRLARAEVLYQQASTFLNQKKEIEAYQRLMELEAFYPDYKVTRSYLEKLKQSFALKGISLAPVGLPVNPEGTDQKSKKEDAVLATYQEAVNLFKDKKNPEALAKFQDIEKRRPDYRSTRKYLTAIDGFENAKKTAKPSSPEGKPQIARVSVPAKKEEPVKTETIAKKVVPQSKSVVPSEKLQEKTKEKEVPHGEKLPRLSEYEAKTAKAEPVYAQGIELYKANRYDEAKAKFDEVSKILPKYKSTDDYQLLIAKNQAPRPEDLHKEAAAVKELSSRSANLFRQIKDLANDKDMASVTRTFSKIDKIIANLESEQNRIAKEIARQEKVAWEAAAKIAKKPETQVVVSKEIVAAIQKKREHQPPDAEHQHLTEMEKERQDLKRQEREKQEQKKNEEREHRLKADAFYQQGMDAFRAKKYSSARERFADAIKEVPGYKDVEQCLIRVDRAEGEEKLLQDENQDKKEIARLAEKANTANTDALKCSQDKDFIGLQAKFSDLEQLLKEIQIIKGRMQLRRDTFAAKWESRADDSKKKLVMKEKIRKMKVAAEHQEARETARKIFHEGEAFYANAEYPEAKVKFLEAARLDPGLLSAKTFVDRIDRIISKRDYEQQKENNKKEARNLERKQEKKEGLIPDAPAGGLVMDVARAKTVYNDGIALYKSKRYKEARIKFEEASKIGNEDQRKKATRYLKLVENALENERKKTEDAKREEEKRLLETKRAEDRMAWQQSDEKQRRVVSHATFEGEGDDAEVQRQLEIRLIEEQNASERNKMLKQGNQSKEKADQEEKGEDRKFQKIAQQENIKTLDKKEVSKDVVKGSVQSEPVTQSESSMTAPKETVPVATDLKAENESRKVLKKNKQLSTTDVREVRRFRRLAAEEKIREEREERQIAALERQKKILLKQDQELIAETGVKKEPVSVSATPGKKVQALVVPPDDRKAAENEKSRLLKVAADGERRLLNQQRAAIQKDFEDGVNRLYNNAVDLFNKQLYEEAHEAFSEVQGLVSGYKKTDDYLKQISQKISVQKEKEAVVIPSPAASPVGLKPADDKNQAVTQVLDRLESATK